MAWWGWGCDVHLAFLPEHSPALHDLDPRIVLHPLPGRGQAAYFTQAGAVRRLWRRLRPDVVNAHYASGYGTLLRVARLRPSVLSAWGSDVFEFPDRGRWQHLLVDGNLRFPDAVTSSSEVMARRIGEVTSGRVSARVIPFGVDLGVFRPGEERAAGSPIRFGIVKTLEPVYRIDVIVQAFAAYLRSAGAPPATLDIYGGGYLAADLRALTADLGVSADVTFHGPIPHADVPAALRALDVFVLASDTESFGVAAIEAMASGVPVIASDCPGFVEVLDAGRYGVLFPRGGRRRAGRTHAAAGDRRDPAARSRRRRAQGGPPATTGNATSPTCWISWSGRPQPVPDPGQLDAAAGAVARPE